MTAMLVKRCIAAVVLLVAVCVLGFVLTGIGDNNPARNILGPEASNAQVAAENHRLGVDRPVLTQFTDWVGSVAHGDFVAVLDEAKAQGAASIAVVGR